MNFILSRPFAKYKQRANAKARFAPNRAQSVAAMQERRRFIGRNCRETHVVSPRNTVDAASDVHRIANDTVHRDDTAGRIDQFQSAGKMHYGCDGRTS
jgi:hypothetical protein